MLNGQWLRTGSSPRLSRRTLNQCDTLEITVAAIAIRTSAVPNRIATSCIRMLSAVGNRSTEVRKKATMPKPNVAMVRVVLIHANVVRSKAS